MAAHEDRADIKKDFDNNILEHVVSVCRDDGVYRHLRCRRPGTIVFGFDIVTWPGYLAITGDMGCYVFSRLNDMFDFFGKCGVKDGINPQYWGEKLQAPDSRDVTEFDLEVYKECVEEWRDEMLEDIPEDEQEEFIGMVESHLLWDFEFEHEAYESLSSFHTRQVTEITNYSEWNFRSYKYHYIWCLYAIVWAIGKYCEEKKDG
jgi:hypothetical protein